MFRRRMSGGVYSGDVLTGGGFQVANIPAANFRVAYY